MRARSHALIGLLVCALGLAAPLFAHAAMVMNLGGTVLFRQTSVIWPAYTYDGITNTKSALRPGDSIGFTAKIATDQSNASFEADLSELDGPDVYTTVPQSTSTDADPSLQDFFFRIDPIAVGSALANGTSSVHLYADAFGGEDRVTVPIPIDATLPAVSISTSTVSKGPNALTLSLTGSAAGTGSKVVALALEGDAYDTAGAHLAGSAPGGHTFVATNLSGLNAVIASSTSGTFAAVPVTVDTTEWPLAQASKLVLTLVVADGAGNLAKASTTVALAPPIPKLSSVLFIPGTEASRLYRRGGNGEEYQVWEPSANSDLPYLAMNPDGTSKYQLYTKDIVDSLEAHSPLEQKIASVFGYNLQVYGDFAKFMDSVVASSTIDMSAWGAYPYDWRYDPVDVVNDGTLTEMPDDSIQRVYLESVLEQMAASSATGKVAIVAHSNGGLVAKALLQKLQQDGKANLVDQLIMIGTPQFGTPSDIGVMLHGDGQSAGGGLIMNPSTARASSEYMPDGYALFPSEAYFTHVASPVVTFDPAGRLTSAYASQYGNSVTSYDAFAKFLEDTAGLNGALPQPSDIRSPLTLSSSLLNDAQKTHAALDVWTLPPGLKVTAIAGWGQLTVSGLAYTTKTKTQCNFKLAIAAPLVCKEIPYLEHAPILTQDGDNTVVSPSAVGDVGQKLYFNLKTFGDAGNKIVHQDLMAAEPVEQEIVSLLENRLRSVSPYVSATLPTGETNPLTQISSHSPVNLVVTDTNGNQSGVVPVPGTDFSAIKQDIPGSIVQVLDDEEYVTVPQSAIYQVTATGYATGTATIDVATVLGSGVASTTASFVDIPVTASSTIALAVANGMPSNARVDTNGDGTTDLQIATATFSGDPLAYIQYMESVVQTMALPHAVNQEVVSRLHEIQKALRSRSRGEHDPGRDGALQDERRTAVLMRQTSVLEQHIEKRVAPTQDEEKEDGASGALEHQPEKRGKRADQELSITQVEQLITMLNYLKTLL